MMGRASEKNRLKKRDKKDKRKFQMKISDGGRRLALFMKARLEARHDRG